MSLPAILLQICCCAVCCSPTLQAVAAPPDGSSEASSSALIEQSIRSRLDSNPQSASAWRAWGVLLLGRGDRPQAQAALRKSVELDPLSAAAHFHLGRLLWINDRAEAERHLVEVLRLAPESEYAEQARELLAELPSESTPQTDVTLVGYEVTPFAASRLFDADKLTDAPPATGLRSRISSRLETGLLYDSNIALAPTSRQLPLRQRASLQAFLAPEAEYILWNVDDVQAGGLFSGNFTFNEGHFKEFNLQSYRPGVYIELLRERPEGTWIPRLQYEWTHDEFLGETFGNRHAILGSVTMQADAGPTTDIFWTTEYTNYADDGVLPEITSRDGLSHVVGVSHTVFPELGLIELLRSGCTLEYTDTTGSDYCFQGVSLFAEVLVPVTSSIDLELETGWGYRDYFDYEFDPGRNEHILRLAAELRKWISRDISLSIVYSFDRFDSESSLFTADRHVSGFVATFAY